MTRRTAALRAAAATLLGLIGWTAPDGVAAAVTSSPSSNVVVPPADRVRRGDRARVLGDVVPVLRTTPAPLEGAGSLRLYATADTIAVFVDSLNTLSSPGNEGGWTHVDDSAQPTGWNIANVYSCGSNAFWCGVIDSSWTGDPNRRGYGNSWTQTLANFADLAGAPSPYTLSFKQRMNVEPGFDFGVVEVLDDEDLWIEIARFSGVVNDGGPTLCNVTNVTIPDSIATQGGLTWFRFLFHSDIEGSSEDGGYAAGEGWAIDDVTVKGGVFDIRFFDDMEAGMGTWTRSIFPAVGDYWKIASNPPTQQVCTTNTSKVWKVSDLVTGALVPRLEDHLISPTVPVNGADQVFLFFDVYRDLPLSACFYYGLAFRTRTVGSAWSAWIDPTELLYFGVEREWLRQTIPLTGAGGVDSVQFRITVKDWGPILCGGSQAVSGTDVLFDNFRVGVLGAAGPSVAAAEFDLYQDTFRTTPFFGNDNFNTPRGDSLAVQIAAANGLMSAFLQYSLNNAPFVPVALTRVGSTSTYAADVPAGAYARGTKLRYYVSATDSLNHAVTLPVDAVAASHYFRASILPGIHASSPGCLDDSARILYVNAWAGPDQVTGVDQSLAALGARYDRFDVNAPDQASGNSPGGGDPSGPGPVWPAVPLSTLATYRSIIWDVGDRAAQTLSAQDQALLSSWATLTGANRGLLLAGDNLAYDLAVNGQGTPNFLTCTLGASFLRDVWENSPQDSLVPNLIGATGTRLVNEPFPADGGCPILNRFDALTVSSCVGANGRSWVRYPNSLAAATERRGALGVPGGDSLRVVLLGASFRYLTSAVRRNLFLYRTVVEEFETPSCYPATAVEPSLPTASRVARLHAPAPNPFNPHTTIRFELGRPARVKLRIYGVAGALVRTLLDRPYPAGSHQIRWDGLDGEGHEAASGAYFLSLEADGERVPSRKVILLR